MTQYDIQTRAGLPTDMQTLLRDLPRDGWQEHPAFARSIQNWMGAHHMFRQLSEILRLETESYLDTGSDPETYVGRLAHFGNLLVRNLHGHHTWEDHHFFPELDAADPRFSAGLEMLEKDHVALDNLLDRFTRQANRVVQLAQLEPAQLRDEVGPVHGHASEIEGFLDRHLTDEEDLAVPILLHHNLRG